MAGFVFTAYRILSPLLPSVARMLGPFSPRMKSFFSLRSSLFADLEKSLNAIPKPPFRVWVHAASVGEFEQARPIITSLKELHPETDIVVSFLSDSGYNARKNFPGASAVFYLPIDTRENARRLMKLLEPDVLLLMRYDFWPNHLAEAKRSGVRLVLAAAVLQKGSPYFNPILKGFYRTIFRLFDAIFTASVEDRDAFVSTFGCTQVKAAGDPRFDQVWERKRLGSAESGKLKPLLEGRMVLVGGSTWPKDEELLKAAWLHHRVKLTLVLVPHKVDPENIERLCRFLEENRIAFEKISSLTASYDAGREVLLVDQTGYLAELYAIASIAYVGGGFGVNVHNTLEPAVYGIPVLFGPRFHNSPEAEAMLKAGAAQVVHDEHELSDALDRLLMNPEELKRRGRLAGEFVNERRGATEIIAGAIGEFLPLRKEVK